MIFLRRTDRGELVAILAMADQAHVKNFVNVSSLEDHQDNYADPNTIYLSIENTAAELVGYFILVVEHETNTVEFGRIVIDENSLGIGQQAIRLMEKYCRSNLNTRRIWLDVYEDNARAIHVYEKQGYRRFERRKYQGRVLFYYEKLL